MTPALQWSVLSVLGGHARHKTRHKKLFAPWVHGCCSLVAVLLAGWSLSSILAAACYGACGRQQDAAGLLAASSLVWRPCSPSRYAGAGLHALLHGLFKVLLWQEVPWCIIPGSPRTRLLRFVLLHSKRFIMFMHGAYSACSSHAVRNKSALNLCRFGVLATHSPASVAATTVTSWPAWIWLQPPLAAVSGCRWVGRASTLLSSLQCIQHKCVT